MSRTVAAENRGTGRVTGRSAMHIGIIGAGRIGGTAARLFACVGHHVTICNSRGPTSLVGLQAAIDAAGGGGRVRVTTVDEAARAGEVVLLAVPWYTPEALPSPAALRGRIVIDAMNPFAADRTLIDLGATTSSELTARRMPGARLVKAFNAISWEHLSTCARVELPLEERHALYVAGDDLDAKRIVMGLVEDIGFAPVDTGSLREGGRRQEPGSWLYEHVLRGGEALARVGR